MPSLFVDLHYVLFRVHEQQQVRRRQQQGVVIALTSSEGHKAVDNEGDHSFVKAKTQRLFVCSSRAVSPVSNAHIFVLPLRAENNDDDDNNNRNSKLSDRQRKLMEDLREEDDRLAGRGSSKTKASSEGTDSKTSAGSSTSGGAGGAASSDEDARSGISGFMRDAYDRVKSHLAGKEAKEKKQNASSSK